MKMFKEKNKGYPLCIIMAFDRIFNITLKSLTGFKVNLRRYDK